MFAKKKNICCKLTIILSAMLFVSTHSATFHSKSRHFMLEQIIPPFADTSVQQTFPGASTHTPIIPCDETEIPHRSPQCYRIMLNKIACKVRPHHRIMFNKIACARGISERSARSSRYSRQQLRMYYCLRTVKGFITILNSALSPLASSETLPD